MDLNKPPMPPVPPAKLYLNVNTMHKCNLMPYNQMFGIMEDGVYLVAPKEGHVQSVDFRYCPYCAAKFYDFKVREEK